MDVKELAQLEDKYSSVSYAESHFNKSDFWDSSTCLRSFQRNPKDLPGQYGRRYQDISAASSNSFIPGPVANGEPRSFEDPAFDNIAGSITVQVIQADVSSLYTAQTPRIAFEDPWMTLNHLVDATSNGLFQKPHLKVGEESQLQGAQQLSLDYMDPSGPGIYPTILDGFDDVRTVLHMSDDAPWSLHATEIGASNFLTPYGGVSHRLGRNVPHPNTSTLGYGHVRSSSSPNLQLHGDTYQRIASGQFQQAFK
ncbi:hypothetical protein E8E12_005687 [Didymella heteroderae]|uniref:Uncharacterized protein n=1 Tax=Didymella heteroderae TaxID=1769908 RepID=A0A9P4WVC5_9PLEO|nr:hypothetical protein E8E12_005687 [Didymella heteroderae]